jgi:sugar lactone lactonase YvrE
LNFTVAVDVRNTLGECPTWDHREQTLYWIDVLEKALFRRGGDGAVRRWELSDHPGSIAVRGSREVLIAFRRGISLFDTGTGKETPIDCPGVDFGKERFNDGACDPLGRFWVGTMDRRLSEPVGGLFCLDDALTLRKAADDVTISNGIAWSPDGRTLYHTDSFTRQIRAHDFDMASGSVAARRVFADFTKLGGTPDGCAMDEAGRLWAVDAHGARILVLASDGALVDEIAAPAARPSSLAFGGADMRTLFVTTMRHDLSMEALERSPASGAVFSARSETAGTQQPRFAG